MRNEDAAKTLNRIRYEGDWTADAFNALSLAISTLKPKKKKKLIERQVFVTWYTPEERMPDDENIVVATVSGKCRNVTLDHALVTAEFYKDEGWCIEPFDFSLKGAWLTVHAWCDLEPYGG